MSTPSLGRALVLFPLELLLLLFLLRAAPCPPRPSLVSSPVSFSVALSVPLRPPGAQAEGDEDVPLTALLGQFAPDDMADGAIPITGGEDDNPFEGIEDVAEAPKASAKARRRSSIVVPSGAQLQQQRKGGGRRPTPAFESPQSKPEVKAWLETAASNLADIAEQDAIRQASMPVASAEERDAQGDALPGHNITMEGASMAEVMQQGESRRTNAARACSEAAADPRAATPLQVDRVRGRSV